MTSKPASRKDAAITLAPRSCPSRPGLATSTRIFLRSSFMGESYSGAGPAVIPGRGSRGDVTLFPCGGGVWGTDLVPKGRWQVERGDQEGAMGDQGRTS